MANIDNTGTIRIHVIFWSGQNIQSGKLWLFKGNSARNAPKQIKRYGMKIGIMQPYFFPYLGYFALINSTDKFVIYDDVAYIKNGWINRNRLKIGTEAHYFSVPVTMASANHLIKDVMIVNYDRFRDDFFKTLQMNYKKAPYYGETIELLSIIFSPNYAYINDLNTSSILKVNEYLDINTKIFISGEIDKNNEFKAEAKVIDICKILGGDIYINAIGGLELYSKENFLEKQIKLYFIKMNEVSYPQGKGGFIPNLSIIDVLMWNSKETINTLLNEYKLL